MICKICGEMLTIEGDICVNCFDENTTIEHL